VRRSGRYNGGVSTPHNPEFAVHIDGLRLAGRPTAHSTYLRQLEEGREGYMTELIKEGLRPGMSVLDVGAHLGYLTLQAARAVGPSGRVYAFEPNPETLGYLRRNVRDNGAVDRVRVLQVALSDAGGTAPFYVTPAGDESRLYRHPTEARRVMARVARGDDVLPADLTVDLVKLDVEGAELAALAGLERTLVAASPALKLFVECNPSALLHAGASSRLLLRRLRELGFSPRLIDEAERRVVPAGDAIEGVTYVNLLCERAEPGGDGRQRDRPRT
jgi:FkbM family methyltransferase